MMTPEIQASPVADLRVGLPKGRMQALVFELLADAGLAVTSGSRDYRPQLPLPACDVKLLKPQNLVRMLAQGSRDLGFAGRDWVEELELDLVDVLDTRLDPVRLVVAAPAALLVDGALPSRSLVLASEYENIAARWIAQRGMEASVVRTYGATEVFPPEDADCILDNTATGATLRANGLVIVDDVLESSTRLYASRQAWNDAGKRSRIEQIAMLLRAVLDARTRVMLELNVEEGDLAAVVEALPCMRKPTIASLHEGAGYAVRAAVPRDGLVDLIPQLRKLGGSDLVVSKLERIVP